MFWLAISDQWTMHKFLVSKIRCTPEVSFNYCVLMMTQMWLQNCAQLLCSDFSQVIKRLSQVLLLLRSNQGSVKKTKPDWWCFCVHLSAAAPTKLQCAAQVESVPVRELESGKGSSYHLKPQLGATTILQNGLHGWQDKLINWTTPFI
jgi:hypothetical protein